MKILRFVLIGAGILVALLIIAVVVVIAVFNPNEHKGRIVQAVKDKTGRTLTIEGDIELKLFPKIGAQLGRTSLSERDSTQVFASVDNVQAFVALLPLLSKRVVVDEVRLDGLTAHLVKFKDGTTNFSDLTGQDAGQKPAEPAPPDGQPADVQLDVSGIRVTDSQITWKDQSNGNDVALHIAELSTGRLADNVPSPIQVRMTARGAQPKLDLGAALDSKLTFDLGKQQYRLDDLDANLTGSALDYSGIALNVKGDVNADGTASQVNVSDFRIEGQASQADNRYDVRISAPSIQANPQVLAVDELSGSASGVMGTLQLNRSEFKAPRLHVDLAKQNVAIAGLSLNAQAKSGTDTVDITLSVPKLDITAEQASGESAQLGVKLAGAQRNGDVTVKVSGVSGSAKALNIASLVLDVDVNQAQNTIAGKLSTPITGNLETKQFALPRLAGDFTITGPAIPQKTAKVQLSGAVKADVSAQQVNADLTTRLDQSRIDAKLGMRKFDQPAYDFDIAIDQLNVDRYLPPEQQATATQQKSATPASAKEEPIDLSALKTLDVDGKLRVGQLQAKNVKASNVRVEVHARDGRLTVNPMAAALYGGSTSGTMSVNANNNQYAVKQRLAGIQIGPLLRDAADKDILEGKGNLNLDITTAGTLISQLKRGLNGQASMQLKDGAVKGIDLAGAVRTVKAKFGGQDAEGAGGKTQKTDFSELTARFTIRNGIAHNEDLNLKSPFIRVSGAGDVNIPDNSLNYVVKTSVVGTMAGQGGKDVAELKGLTIPVRVSGTFDALKYKVEFSEMLSAGGKEALKETAREALKGQVDKQLGKGALDSLLGRKQKEGSGAKEESGGTPGAGTKPEEQIKDRLKGLLR